MRTPLGDRYLSALIAQCLARSRRKRKVPGSNSSVGKDFSFCNSWRSSQVESAYANKVNHDMLRANTLI